ncbi:hypothetical protein PQ459_04555 [Chryseobacterium sp. KACC 21268]|nr:hypothetical protein PQ459_04555 [Chryseobacterium sp. KACC 21268]
MKKIIFLLITFIILMNCSDLIGEKEKYANTIISKVELYKKENGQLPESLRQIGIDEKEESLSFYVKKSKDEYEVWYGLDLGTSKVYNSRTKKWKKSYG